MVRLLGMSELKLKPVRQAHESQDQLPKGWGIKKLSDVCKVIAEQSPQSMYYNDTIDGLPFYQGKKEFREKYIGEPVKWTTKVTKEAIENDVLMSVRAPVVPINFSTQKICIGRGLASIRAGKLIDREFLFNFLLKHENEIVGNTGAVFNSINKTQIGSIEIPLPPLPEQKRIVSIPDKAFAEIEKVKSNAQQNLKNAKELFESYLQEIFKNRDEGWEEKTFYEILQKTETINPKLKPKAQIIYLDVSSVNKETKQIEKTNKLLGNDAPGRARKLVKINDVIFATIRPTHSRVARITEEFNNQVCSTGYYVFRAKELLSNNYIYYFLLTYGFNKQMEQLQKGASFPAVTNKEVESIKIPFPISLKKQKQIVLKLDQLSSETKKMENIYQKKIDYLEELKKSVLQKAFRGEL
jgi:type I restriction enzyme, S subunit